MTRFTITGRLVQGDPHKMRQQTDDDGNAKTRVDQATGQSVPFLQAFVAIAIPKNPAARIVIAGNPTYEQTKANLDAAAKAAFPDFFNTSRAEGLQYAASLPDGCTHPKFANKVIDGDGFDKHGRKFTNEGWAGCWIIKCANGFPPKVYEWSASGWQETVHTGRTIKCGDFVTVSGECVTNKRTDSPGMYMNFDTVAFEQEGDFIASAGAVDPNQALGNRGGNPPASGAANSAHAGGAGGGADGTGGSTTASGQTGEPYSGYREDAAPLPPEDDAPPPPSGPAMTAKANGKSYESFTAKGWTDDQLRSHGYIA